MDEERTLCDKCLGEGFFMKGKVAKKCTKCKGDGYIYGVTEATKRRNSKSDRWKP